MLKRLSLIAIILFGLTASSCVTIQIKEGTTCSTAGLLEDGDICSHLISPATDGLTFTETVDFLEAQEARTCAVVPNTTVCMSQDDPAWLSTLPTTALAARAGAISLSTDDFGTMKTELETLCRAQGKNCTFEAQMLIKSMQAHLDMIAAHLTAHPPHHVVPFEIRFPR